CGLPTRFHDPQRPQLVRLGKPSVSGGAFGRNWAELLTPYRVAIHLPGDRQLCVPEDPTLVAAPARSRAATANRTCGLAKAHADSALARLARLAIAARQPAGSPPRKPGRAI